MLALAWLSLAGCSSPKTAIYEHENFADSGTFSRNYPVSDIASCEAARRALLSQGYIITSNDPRQVSGHKSFQQTGESHLEISFNVVCVADASSEHSSTLFANALQDRYALKKVNNSASVGVGVLGSVSMPIGSTDDSMVKVASETVASDKFYDRYFSLVESFMPVSAKKTVSTPPAKEELGVPDTAPAPLAAPTASTAAATAKPVVPVAAPLVQPTPAAAQVQQAEAVPEQEASQPVAPPAQPAPIEVIPVPEATEATPEVVPQAPAVEAPVSQP
ncbi:DUF2242 domain-containing protein [Pseudomonas sp. CFBP 8770]|uniref:DUF2242 domain-containing protein n=1 Tax=unclassified Pseudomonas TaxID=196821 RepID=UPI0017847C3F|nr:MULTISPECIES: DUF2242 domain-containing protein [unclassified Pseudomonas]MBD8475066.1 DUF2242 domain-containing protein [Pseudomonas sp. CFBP 8773]MBD8645671.1 DUF2242 domain-containing protein [Pseudomonas sp. CFBP 8770]